MGGWAEKRTKKKGKTASPGNSMPHAKTAQKTKNWIRKREPVKCSDWVFNWVSRKGIPLTFYFAFLVSFSFLRLGWLPGFLFAPVIWQMMEWFCSGLFGLVEIFFFLRPRFLVCFRTLIHFRWRKFFVCLAGGAHWTIRERKLGVGRVVAMPCQLAQPAP